MLIASRLDLREPLLFVDDGPAGARAMRFGAVTFGLMATYARRVRPPTLVNEEDRP
jgi:hypothetical protein